MTEKRGVWYSVSMVRMILGRAGTGKTARILREIAARVGAEQGPNILLVPEQYSHEAERELCRAAGDRLSLFGEVLSFTGFARKVFGEFGGARPSMDGGGRLLCMAWAMDRLPPESLRLYRRGRKDVRVTDSLVRAMQELRLAGADADRLLASAESGDLPGLLGDKLRELAVIMEAYAAALERSAADPADRLETLAERIASDAEVRARVSAMTFYVDGFSDFTELEKRVLRELIRAGAAVTVCLTCPDGGEREGVFALTGRTARWLEETAAETGQPCVRETAEAEGDMTPIRYLCEHLFDFSRGGAPADDGSVRLVTAADPYEECELAASRMAELARGGARWRDMAVAVRGFADYRTALESACARFGVPLFLSGRGDMLRKSVPLLIASALEAVTHGYEYEAVFGFLKTGLGPIDLSACDRLENYAVLWNVRGTLWERPFTMHPDGYNEPLDEAAAARLAALNESRAAVIAPLKKLESAMKAAGDARGQAQALSDFLEDLGLAEKLAARADELEAAGRRETAAEYDQLWETVCSALEQFADVLGDTPMDAAEFRDLFCRMLSKYDVSVIPVSLDRVQAGDFDGMRRRHIKYLFVLGAADGRLPAPEEEAGVFTPEEREELTAMGLALGGPEEDLAREFWRIYSCLSLPSDELYMSWPRSGDDGETRPSSVAERAMSLFGLVPERGDILRARTFSREAAYTLAVLGEAGSREPVCAAARQVFADAGQGEALRGLVERASAGRGRLGPEGVERLYGERPVVTATRAQKFGDCRFAYFLQYGLKAKPRQRAVFDARDNGTFLHWILEKTAGAVMERGGFDKVTEEEVAQLADGFVDEYIHRELNDFAEKTARFAYLFRRLRASVRHVVTELWQELKDSQFRPVALELDLAADGVLAPSDEDGEMRLYGKIDRVDAWEHDGALYLRVVDYKTGQKKFRLSDICEGMNMQMLLYLFSLVRRGEGYFRDKGFDVSELRPAGVLYSQARFRVVRADSSTEQSVARDRMAGVDSEGRHSGLILDDPAAIEAMEPGGEGQKRFLPVKIKVDGKTGETGYEGQLAKLEDFGALSRFIGDTLRDMAAELRAGSVEADPWFTSAGSNACANCEYAEACLFDESRDGWRLRETLKPEEAWEKIRGNCDE